MDNVAYFGMPKNIDHEGYVNGTNDLCTLDPQLGVEPRKDCIPMEKTFYLQYQYMAFLVASLSILFYAPYLLFCRVNKDMISLKETIISENQAATLDTITEVYFKEDCTTKFSCLRNILTVLIKCLYVCTNLISLLVLDNVLNGEYLEYGIRWIEWSNLDNSLMYDYMGMRDFPKPGNKLLPPFGYCELYESASDVKRVKANKIKLVCEISQHVLFQYCLLLLWYAIVVGIFVSFVGFVQQVVVYVSNVVRTKRGSFRRAGLTLRQVDYLDYINSHDIDLYEEIVQILTDDDGKHALEEKEEFES